MDIGYQVPALVAGGSRGDQNPFGFPPPERFGGDAKDVCGFLN